MNDQKADTEPNHDESIHDTLAAKRAQLVADLQAVDVEIAEAAEAARVGNAV